MSDKFQNRYRIPSARLPNWDYGSNGRYFVTICTLQHQCYFGNVVDEKMELSEIGMIAHQHWLDIPIHFPFALLGEFIVMPNHVHGIIVIDKPDNDRIGTGAMVGVRGAINRASNTNTNNKPETNHHIGGFAGNKNPMINDNLSRIIRWYKGRVAFESRKFNPDFVWQSRFYDHIIRNDQSFQRISAYIVNNPSKWTGS